MYKLLEDNKTNPFFLKLLKGGIIPLTVLDYKVYYEYYLSELKKVTGIEQAMQNVCEEYNISRATVVRARKLMTK